MKNEVLEPEVTDETPAKQTLQLPQYPSWDKARELAGRIRGGAEAIVELGLELKALKQQFYSVGGRPPKNSTQGALSLSGAEIRRAQNGWQEAVRDQLGISHDTAQRWMDRAFVIITFQKLKAGEAVEYRPTGRKQEPMRLLEPTPEVLERIDEAMDNVVTGTVAAPRAFAGVVGEAMRRTKQSGTSAKAPTDHAENIRAALTKLKTSLPYFKRLPLEVRTELEQKWIEDVRDILPETWIQE